MRKIVHFISIVSLSLCVMQCASDEKALHKKLNEMAVNLNESAPVMLDQFTRFDSAMVLPEKAFQYNYTVLNIANPDSLVSEGLKTLQQSIGKQFSSNPDLLIFKENNVVIEYVYKEPSGEIIQSLRIMPDDYQ